MAKDEQGVFRDRYQIIPRTLLFMIREGDVLLLKGAPDKKLWANRYNGIGGHIEQGEDVRQAVLRELKEETGLQVSTLKLCATIMIDAGAHIGIGMFVFRGAYEGGELIESKEGRLAWIPISEVTHYELVEDLPVLIPAILSLAEEDEPLSISYSYDDNEKLVIKINP